MLCTLVLAFKNPHFLFVYHFLNPILSILLTPEIIKQKKTQQQSSCWHKFAFYSDYFSLQKNVLSSSSSWTALTKNIAHFLTKDDHRKKKLTGWLDYSHLSEVSEEAWKIKRLLIEVILWSPNAKGFLTLRSMKKSIHGINIQKSITCF